MVENSGEPFYGGPATERIHSQQQYAAPASLGPGTDTRSSGRLSATLHDDDGHSILQHATRPHSNLADTWRLHSHVKSVFPASQRYENLSWRLHAMQRRRSSASSLPADSSSGASSGGSGGTNRATDPHEYRRRSSADDIDTSNRAAEATDGRDLIDQAMAALSAAASASPTMPDTMQNIGAARSLHHTAYGAQEATDAGLLALLAADSQQSAAIPSPARPPPPPPRHVSIEPVNLFCYKCLTRETSMWHQSDTSTPIILCNACVAEYERERQLRRQQRLGRRMQELAGGGPRPSSDVSINSTSTGCIPPPAQSPHSLHSPRYQQQPQQPQPQQQSSSRQATSQLPSPRATTAMDIAETLVWRNTQIEMPAGYSCVFRASSSQQQACANCATVTTPLWRRGTTGECLCNACGLYFKLHMKMRPVSMKSDVIKKRVRLPNNGGATAVSSSAGGATSGGVGTNSGNVTEQPVKKGRKRVDSNDIHDEAVDSGAALGSSSNTAGTSASTPQVVGTTDTVAAFAPAAANDFRLQSPQLPPQRPRSRNYAPQYAQAQLSSTSHGLSGSTHTQQQLRHQQQQRLQHFVDNSAANTTARNPFRHRDYPQYLTTSVVGMNDHHMMGHPSSFSHQQQQSRLQQQQQLDTTAAISPVDRSALMLPPDWPTASHTCRRVG